MKKFLNWFSNEESGQGMVEYGLILAGIAVAVIVVIFTLGGKIKDLFTSVSDQIDGPPAS